LSIKLDIVVVAARTPVGLTAETSAAAVRGTISRLREFPFVGPRGEPVIVAADPRLTPNLEGRDRLLPMIQAVLAEVDGKLDAAGAESGRCQRYLLLALPETRPGFSEQDATWVADTLRARRRADDAPTDVTVVARGHAGVIRAVEFVVQEATRHSDALFIVVGADSYHHAETFLWLESQRQFAQPGVRNGFVPGEGVGAVVFTSSSRRARLRLPHLAGLRGACTAQETRLRHSETGSFGVAMTQAVLGATSGLVLPRDAPDTVYSDINGERYRSEEWGFVVLRAPAAFETPSYEAPADCWGDVGAASGALATVLAVQSFARGYARGPRALIMAASENGLRGALVVQDPRVA
jgi:3-oxoacyl-[acyl-carrier-protein] synthase-1